MFGPDHDAADFESADHVENAINRSANATVSPPRCFVVWVVARLWRWSSDGGMVVVSRFLRLTGRTWEWAGLGRQQRRQQRSKPNRADQSRSRVADQISTTPPPPRRHHQSTAAPPKFVHRARNV
ncbi:hypothetical protein SO802_006407 [Lithocarpus litseifolius]|uniref:Uncharacterized protein n=1 Tax=Lithocarpus litseifolius TaxID=425828 RepID=A0AAW2DME9_9ROSI